MADRVFYYSFGDPELDSPEPPDTPNSQEPASSPSADQVRLEIWLRVAMAARRDVARRDVAARRWLQMFNRDARRIRADIRRAGLLGARAPEVTRPMLYPTGIVARMVEELEDAGAPDRATAAAVAFVVECAERLLDFDPRRLLCRPSLVARAARLDFGALGAPGSLGAPEAPGARRAACPGVRDVLVRCFRGNTTPASLRHTFAQVLGMASTPARLERYLEWFPEVGELYVGDANCAAAISLLFMNPQCAADLALRLPLESYSAERLCEALGDLVWRRPHYLDSGSARRALAALAPVLGSRSGGHSGGSGALACPGAAGVLRASRLFGPHRSSSGYRCAAEFMAAGFPLELRSLADRAALGAVLRSMEKCLRVGHTNLHFWDNPLWWPTRCIEAASASARVEGSEVSHPPIPAALLDEIAAAPWSAQWSLLLVADVEHMREPGCELGDLRALAAAVPVAQELAARGFSLAAARRHCARGFAQLGTNLQTLREELLALRWYFEAPDAGPDAFIEDGLEPGVRLRLGLGLMQWAHPEIATI